MHRVQGSFVPSTETLYKRRSRYGIGLRTLAGFLGLVLFAQSTGWAAPEASAALQTLLPLNLPAQAGTIRERFTGRSPYTVYLIEEAHANPGAERRIASILEAIAASDSRFGGVFVEGSSTELGMDDLAGLADPASRRAIAERHLKSGRMHGDEYLQLVSGRALRVRGLEDPSLYRRALASYRRTAARRARLLDYLAGVRVSLKALDGDFQDPLLADFLEQRKRFEDGGLPVTGYIEKLQAAARRLKLDPSGLAALEAWNRVRDLERRVDFKQAQREAVQVLGSMPDAPIRPEEIRDLREQLRAFEILERQASGLPGDRPALRAYIEYARSAARIDAQALLQDMRTLEQEILSVWPRTADEATLVRAHLTVEGYEKLFKLEMTPEEFAAHLQRTKGFGLASAAGFVNRRLAERGGPYEKAVRHLAGFHAAAHDAERFYRLSFDRDRLFVSVLTASVGTGARSAVLVAGGFHAPNLRKILRERGISYADLVPAVTEETNRGRYEDLLLSGRRGAGIDVSIGPSMIALPHVFSDPGTVEHAMLGRELTASAQGARLSFDIKKAESAAVDVIRRNRWAAPQLRRGADNYNLQELFLELDDNARRTIDVDISRARPGVVTVLVATANRTAALHKIDGLSKPFFAQIVNRRESVTAEDFTQWIAGVQSAIDEHRAALDLKADAAAGARLSRSRWIAGAIFFFMPAVSQAAQFVRDSAGNLAVKVQAGDTWGHIVEKLRVVYNGAEHSGYLNSDLHGTFWGPHGVVHRMWDAVPDLAHRAIFGFIKDGETISLSHIKLPDSVITQLTGQGPVSHAPTLTPPGFHGFVAQINPVSLLEPIWNYIAQNPGEVTAYTAAAAASIYGLLKLWRWLRNRGTTSTTTPASVPAPAAAAAPAVRRSSSSPYASPYDMYASPYDSYTYGYGGPYAYGYPDAYGYPGYGYGYPAYGYDYGYGYDPVYGYGYGYGYDAYGVYGPLYGYGYGDGYAYGYHYDADFNYEYGYGYGGYAYRDYAAGLTARPLSDGGILSALAHFLSRLKSTDQPKAPGTLDGRQIAIVVPDFGVIGGVETYMQRLVGSLATRNAMVIHVVATSGIQPPGVWTQRVGSSTIVYHSIPRDQQALKQRLAKLAPVLNLVINHTPYSWEGVVTAETARELGVPAVVQFHGGHRPNKDEHPDYPDDYLQFMGLGPTVGDAMRAATGRAAVSRSGVRALDELGIPGGVDLGPMIDFESFDVDLADPHRMRREHGLEGRFVLFAPNRLHAFKGAMDILQTVKRLVDAGKKDVTAVLMGSVQDNAYYDALLAYIRENHLEDHVKILPPTGERADLRDWYAASDVVLLPSYDEGFGLVVAEAQLLEKPVVAYNVGGIPEAMRPDVSGFLVPTGRTDALAAAVTRLHDDRELGQRMGRAGRAYIRDRFAIDRMIEGHEAYYLGLMAPAAAPKTPQAPEVRVYAAQGELPANAERIARVLADDADFMPEFRLPGTARIEFSMVAANELSTVYQVKTVGPSGNTAASFAVKIYNYDPVNDETRYAQTSAEVHRELERQSPELVSGGLRVFIGNHPTDHHRLIAVRRDFIEGATAGSLIEENRAAEKRADKLYFSKRALIAYLTMWRSLGYLIRDPNPYNVILANGREGKLFDLDFKTPPLSAREAFDRIRKDWMNTLSESDFNEAFRDAAVQTGLQDRFPWVVQAEAGTEAPAVLTPSGARLASLEALKTFALGLAAAFTLTGQAYAFEGAGLVRLREEGGKVTASSVYTGEIVQDTAAARLAGSKTAETPGSGADLQQWLLNLRERDNALRQILADPSLSSEAPVAVNIRLELFSDEALDVMAGLIRRGRREGELKNAVFIATGPAADVERALSNPAVSDVLLAAKPTDYRDAPEVELLPVSSQPFQGWNLPFADDSIKETGILSGALLVFAVKVGRLDAGASVPEPIYSAYKTISGTDLSKETVRDILLGRADLSVRSAHALRPLLGARLTEVVRLYRLMRRMLDQSA